MKVSSTFKFQFFLEFFNRISLEKKTMSLFFTQLNYTKQRIDETWGSQVKRKIKSSYG